MKIADSELEVMRILWREAKPVSFAQIRKELEQTKGWKKSTIQTLVVRLRDKGVIAAHIDNVTLYTPNISETDYILVEGQNFIDKLFTGSAVKMVAAMAKSGQLSKGDIDELREFFKMEED